MFNGLDAKRKRYQEMGEFAKEASAEELRKKYAPEPEVEEVPGAEEQDGMEAAASEGGEMEEIEALLSKLSPEEIEALLQSK